MSNNKQETQAVKRALAKVGIAAKITHTGGGSGWLKIGILGQGAYINRALENEAIAIAQAVTGRSGNFDGYISAYFAS